MFGVDEGDEAKRRVCDDEDGGVAGEWWWEGEGRRKANEEGEMSVVVATRRTKREEGRGIESFFWVVMRTCVKYVMERSEAYKRY